MRARGILAALGILALVAIAAAMLLSSRPGPASAAGDIVAVSAGNRHTCALTDAGGVRCWGSNSRGQLGDGTNDSSSSPVDVAGLASGMTAISAGAFYTCALTTAGGVKCWGRNLSGQLGDGTTDDRDTPVDVTGLTSGVTAIAAGGEHTCALTTSGGVQCWGWNGNGQIGNFNAPDPSLTPVPVCSGGGMFPCLSDLSSVAAIAAGGAYTCALTTAGGVKCWGQNFWGQLGDGTTDDRSTPVDVSGLTSGVDAIAAGSGSTCAIENLQFLTGGVLSCWGRNHHGQLGDGTTDDRHTPVSVTGNISSVSTSGAHTCAQKRRLTGQPPFLIYVTALQCWGLNDDSQLGDGSTADRTTPVDVVGLTSGVAAVTTGGGFHTCALTGGAVKCWGWNGYGQLGDGTTNNSSIPIDIGVKPTPAATDTPTPTATATPTPTATPPAEPGETGDVDKDGDVNVFDALAILNALAGFEPLEFPDNGDVNGDGTTNIFDVLAVLGIVVSAP